MLCDLENMFETLKLNATRCCHKNVRLGAKVVKGSFGTQIIPKYPRILLYSFLRSIAETANPLCGGSLLFMTSSDDIGNDGHLSTLVPAPSTHICQRGSCEFIIFPYSFEPEVFLF